MAGLQSSSAIGKRTALILLLSLVTLTCHPCGVCGDPDAPPASVSMIGDTVACVLTCEDGKRFVAAGDGCRSSVEACYLGFPGTSADVGCPYPAKKRTVDGYPFENNGQCLEFINQVLQPSQTDSSWQTKEEVQEAQCGCIDMVKTLLEVGLGSQASSTSFCDDVMGRVSDRLGNTLCAKKFIPSAAKFAKKMCSTLVTTVSDKTIGFALKPLCNVMVNIVKREFKVDLNKLPSSFQKDLDGWSKKACGQLTCKDDMNKELCALQSSASGAGSKVLAVATDMYCTVSNAAGGGSSSGACFPGHATVLVSIGGGKYAVKFMRDLLLGDKIVAIDPTSGKHRVEEIYMFTHRSDAQKTVFITLETSTGHTLSASPGHYLFSSDAGNISGRINGSNSKPDQTDPEPPMLNKSAKIVRAADIKIGDYLWVMPYNSTKGDHIVALDEMHAFPAPAVVTSVSPSHGLGLYNPHTPSGALLVDGVAALEFTDVLPPSLAIYHAATLPARALSAALPKSAVETVNEWLMRVYFGHDWSFTTDPRWQTLGSTM